MNRPRSQPGFTLIEVMLASLLASLVAAGCFAVVNALNRADRTLDRRYSDVVELERLRNVMQRAFMSLVVSGQPRPRDATRPGAGPAGTNDPNSRGDRAPNNAPQNRPPGADQPPGSNPGGSSAGDTPPPAPRVLLTADPRAGAMSHERSRMNPGGAPQRLELVLTWTPPSPEGPATASRLNRDSTAEQALLEGNESPGLNAVRGQFTLRRDEDSAVPSWTVWWQPLRTAPGSAEADSRASSPEPAGPAVRIASGLASCRWQVYDDRAKKPEFAAVWDNDLPAYVEMEVITVNGLKAEWMFEIDWSSGEETALEAPTDDEPGAAGDEKNADPRGDARRDTRRPGGVQ